jgi:hypothetical protein
MKLRDLSEKILTEDEIEDEIEKRLELLGPLSEQDFVEEVNEFGATADPFGLHILQPRTLDVRRDDIHDVTEDAFLQEIVHNYQSQIAKLDQYSGELQNLKVLANEIVNKCEHVTVPERTKDNEDLGNIPVTINQEFPQIETIVTNMRTQPTTVQEVPLPPRDPSTISTTLVVQHPPMQSSSTKTLTQRLNEEEERLLYEKQERIRMRHLRMQQEQHRQSLHKKEDGEQSMKVTPQSDIPQDTHNQTQADNSITSTTTTTTSGIEEDTISISVPTQVISKPQPLVIRSFKRKRLHDPVKLSSNIATAVADLLLLPTDVQRQTLEDWRLLVLQAILTMDHSNETYSTTKVNSVHQPRQTLSYIKDVKPSAKDTPITENLLLMSCKGATTVDQIQKLDLSSEGISKVNKLLFLLSY